MRAHPVVPCLRGESEESFDELTAPNLQPHCLNLSLYLHADTTDPRPQAAFAVTGLSAWTPLVHHRSWPSHSLLSHWSAEQAFPNTWQWEQADFLQHCVLTKLAFSDVDRAWFLYQCRFLQHLALAGCIFSTTGLHSGMTFYCAGPCADKALQHLAPVENTSCDLGSSNAPWLAASPDTPEGRFPGSHVERPSAICLPGPFKWSLISAWWERDLSWALYISPKDSGWS